MHGRVPIMPCRCSALPLSTTLLRCAIGLTCRKACRANVHMRWASLMICNRARVRRCASWRHAAAGNTIEHLRFKACLAHTQPHRGSLSLDYVPAKIVGLRHMDSDATPKVAHPSAALQLGILISAHIARVRHQDDILRGHPALPTSKQKNRPYLSSPAPSQYDTACAQAIEWHRVDMLLHHCTKRT